jgi:uncharacterized protein with ATP-grasp and redox domains
VAREVAEDEWLHRKVLEEAMGSLPGSDWGRSPAEVLTDVFASARKTLRAPDPFHAKRRELALEMRALAAEHRAAMAKAKDPFALATLGAAAANVVDALVLGNFDVASAFRALVARGFSQGSPDDLRAALEGIPSVLYVLDNAGEAAFDLILVEEIKKLGKAVTVVARRPGLIHDATVEDAVLAGFAEGDVIDTGQDGLLGASPVLCGPDFRAAFEAAPLVIAKGSACYETLTGERKETVFLLHGKCEPVARALGCAVGDLVLIKT